MLEDTNDIGFQAVEVMDGFGVEPGVWFRLALGGITGHRDFARDTGVIVQPADATKVADAIVRVFIEHGDRTDRNKARLKYVLDALGLREVPGAGRGEARRASSTRVPPEAIAPRPGFDRAAHIGVHAQKQAGLNWIGVVLPVGKLTAEQMRGLAEHRARAGRRRYPPHGLAEPADLRRAGRQGRGAPRPRSKRSAFRPRRPSIRAGLVACTGNAGCRFAASDTKRHAEDIARWCEARVELDGPVNIHLTGCHHSCAQHYIGDIGLIGLQGADLRRGRHGRGLSRPRRRRLRSGGGARRARSIRDVKAEDAPRTVERMLKAYLAHRAAPDESFLAFTRRHEIDALKAMCDAEAAA